MDGLAGTASTTTSRRRFLDLLLGASLLGVGLHSYGFMQKAFPWLCGFILSQFALMCVAAMPFERWRSFRMPAHARRRKSESGDLKFVPPGLPVKTTPE